MGFRALRVINEDVVAPATGFGKHPHRDMEILSYVLEGAVRHEDSMGSSEVLRPGELQRMSAGSGVRHSEWNAPETEPFHMLQIWLMPNQTGVTPQYGQKRFAVAEQPNVLHLMASKDGREGSFAIHADAELLAARLEVGASVSHRFRGGYGWLQVARGSVEVDGLTLEAGDGAAITAEATITVASSGGGEFLLFDLD